MAPSTGFVWPFFIILLTLGMGGLPVNVPPLPEDPALVRAAPAGTLFYVGWNGMATARPDSKNLTELLYANAENRHMVKAIEGALLRTLVREARGEVDVKEIWGLARRLLCRPGCLYLAGLKMEAGDPLPSAGLVVNLGGEAAALQAGLDKYINMALTMGMGSPPLGSLTVGGSTFKALQVPGTPLRFAWGYHKNYFIVALGEGVLTAAVAGLDGGQGLESTKGYANLMGAVKVSRPALKAWLDVPAVIKLVKPLAGPKAGEILATLGLDNLVGVAWQAGLDGRVSRSRSIVGIQGQPKGLLALYGGTPLSKAELDTIPGDADMATAFRLDTLKAYKMVLKVLEMIEPRDVRRFQERELPQMEQALGINLERDILGSLGSCWRLWNSPREGGLVFTGLTLAVSVEDKLKFATTLARLHGFMAGEMNRRRFYSSGRQRRGAYLDRLEFAGKDIHFVNFVGDDVPVAPAWCFDGENLLVSLFPQTLKAHLAYGKGPGPAFSERPEVAALEGSAMISVTDMRRAVATAWPLINGLAQMACGELQREGLNLSVAVLPSPAAILPYLEKQVVSIRYTAGAIVQDSMGTLPLIDGLLVGNIGALGLLAPGTLFLGTVREVRAPARVRRPERRIVPRPPVRRPPVEEVPEIVEVPSRAERLAETKAMAKLKHLYSAIQIFELQNRRRPSRLEELWAGPNPLLLGGEPKGPKGRRFTYRGQGVRTGVLVFSQPQADGGRLVLFCSGKVQRLSAAQFIQALRRK